MPTLQSRKLEFCIRPSACTAGVAANSARGEKGTNLNLKAAKFCALQVATTGVGQLEPQQNKNFNYSAEEPHICELISDGLVLTVDRLELSLTLTLT